MKTLVVISGTAHRGKTSSIKAIYKKLSDFTILPKDVKDICEVCFYKGKNIGLASAGDPGSSQREDIENCILQGCEIIVCASRTSGSTVQNVYSLAKQYEYNIIWTFHYSDETGSSILPNGTNLNEVFANNMLTLFDKLI